jgi:hypothetical protein
LRKVVQLDNQSRIDTKLQFVKIPSTVVVMSDEVNTERVVDDIVSSLSIPESGTVRRDVAVRTPPYDSTPHVSVEAGIPMQLAREIIDDAEGRVDLRRRGKVGEAIVDLDSETWELEIEGDSV